MGNIEYLGLIQANKANAQLAQIASEWLAWVPTITWVTATPSDVVTVARYKQIGKVVFFNVLITATNGNGVTTGSEISLPILPKTNNVSPVCYGYQKVAGAISSRNSFIRDDGVNNEIYLASWTTATAGSSLEIGVSGTYEIA